MMQEWLLLGLLGYLCYSVSTAIDKFFMKEGYNPASANTFKMFFDGVILLAIGFLFFELSFSFGLLFWALLLGGMYAFGGILYFTALQSTDVEVVVPYMQSLNLLLVFLGAVLLFNEATSTLNYLGLVLILLGIYAVLSRPFFRFPKKEKSLLLMSAAVLVGIVYSLLVKALLADIKPINLAIAMYFASALVMALYLFLSRQPKSFDLKNSRIVFSALFGAFGTLFVYSALSIGLASKVYAMSGIQSVFVFAIALLFLKQRFYLHRLLGIAAVFAGIFLVSI